MMDSILQGQRGSRRLVGGWLLLALCALALSTVCAVLLIVARTPWLGTPSGFGELFGRALVLHVGLAVVVWFLACAAGLWSLASGAEPGPVRWGALGLAGLGLSAMVVPLFLQAARPVLANYVPVLQHPVFFTGLASFIVGVAMTGACAVLPVARASRQGSVWHFGVLLSIVAASFALVAFIASLVTLREGAPAANFEFLAWGPGHVLQFVHVILLMGVWTVLGEQALEGQPIASRRWLQVLLAMAAVPLLGVPVIYGVYPIDSADFRLLFTRLMAWSVWPAAAVLSLRILFLLRRVDRKALASPRLSALILSILLFLLGCVLGAMIRTDSTMVPAHYHGTVGAVTLAYMALGYRLIPSFGGTLNDSAMARWQPVVYGSGLIILALALAWSGSLGVPRKTLHVDVMVQYPEYFMAMGLAGLGGLMAIGGAGLFVFNIGRSFRNGVGEASARPQRVDIRSKAFVLTGMLVVTLGAFLAYWSTDQGDAVVLAPADPQADPKGHASQMRKAEIDRRFAKGVVLLNARQYEESATEFHRVLELAPQMPEAHVNMGFSLIGQQRYAIAKDFFDTAIELNRNQINAYYGLAEALEGLNDLPGALGAMRSFQHLNKTDNAFAAKANAAIWEWEAAVEKMRAESRSAPSSASSLSALGSRVGGGDKRVAN